MQDRLRVLVITKLFPNGVAPSFAVFNRQQFAALGRLCDVEVMAVIPTYPGVAWMAPMSDAGRFSAVPAQETIDGLRVRHPRALFLPKIGRALAPALYQASLWPHVRRQRGRCDVVLGSWAFPDGVAAIALARQLGVPAVVKVHGSDLNVLARQRSIRRALCRSLPRADRIVAVSRPLALRAQELGVAPDRIAVVVNGVDRDVFRVRPRAQARQAVGMPEEGSSIVYVGRLDLAKGLGELLQAFESVAKHDAGTRLVLVGGGPELSRCQAFAARLPGRVVVAGPQPLDRVADHVAACDVLALPSWNEGTPNVILEAFASGRPVVATRVGGIPDLVTSDALGLLVAPRDGGALADALRVALGRRYDADAIAAAAPPSWHASASALHDVLRAAVQRAAGRPAPMPTVAAGEPALQVGP